jgi:SAM-dependent methyltransferase
MMEGLMANIEAGSPERFGYSWERFAKLSPEQEQQFILWTSGVDPQAGWRGKQFLDAGCGAGRNSYWPMTYGAAGGVSIDLDDRSLEAAKANLARFPTMRVEKASIYEIPYQDKFDIAFSIGVVHHLGDPALAVRQLAKATKPGGKVLIWVYGYENLEFYVHVLNPVRKALFSWLPLPLVRLLAYIPTAALYLMLRLGITPIAYLRLLRKFPFMHLHHIVFDQMLPRTANYWRKDEAIALMQQAGLTDLHAEHVNECSWTVTGIKPQPPAAA